MLALYTLTNWEKCTQGEASLHENRLTSRAVRIMYVIATGPTDCRREQQFFEKRAQGFQDGFLGYRKSDALLAQTYFNGLRYDPVVTQRKLNYTGTNVLVLSLGNC